MKAIIIAGGTAPSLKLLKNEITHNSIIIAADSGANCLFSYKVTPNYIIGDLDSITPKARKFFEKKPVVFERAPRDKDSTDAFLALHKAIALGAKEITFFGCTGGKRIDHFIGSLGLLAFCLKHKIKATIKDETNCISLHAKSFTISGQPGTIFSLFAYSNMVKGLTIKGGKYKLLSYKLLSGDPRTISNEFALNPVKISFSSGKLMLIRTNNLCTQN